jgi:pimeloyl-ACP methyl ester carboxylesterase
MKLLKYFGVFFLIVAILYLAGPHPSHPVFTNNLPAIPTDVALQENSITAGEATHKLKPGNEARIIWQNDSLKQKTAYAIVHLHGFGASQGDGDPLHKDVAKKFGCNLYLSRLAEHGLDTSEALLNCTADKLWNAAKEAYAIGKQLGDKVIILSTSTGGTLALMLAAKYPEIAGLLLISPNIAINDPNAWLANNHWGYR